MRRLTGGWAVPRVAAVEAPVSLWELYRLVALDHVRFRVCGSAMEVSLDDLAAVIDRHEVALARSGAAVDPLMAVRLEWLGRPAGQLGSEGPINGLGQQSFDAGSRAWDLGWASSVPAVESVKAAMGLLVVAATSATAATGASVSLSRYGRLATVAATDSVISAMDSSQYARGEGPCVDASIEGRWFHADAVETETRWPAFIRTARQLGIGSILSSPLFSSSLHPVGALNMYCLTPGAFGFADQELAATLASSAGPVLSGAHAA